MCKWTKEDFAVNATRFRIPFADFRECGVEIRALDVAFKFDHKVDLEAINAGPYPGENGPFVNHQAKREQQQQQTEQQTEQVQEPVAVLAGSSPPIFSAPTLGLVALGAGLGLLGWVVVSTLKKRVAN